MNKTTWKRVKLGEVAEINPLESIKKNTLAKKVSMDNLEPFNKKIYSFSMESFKGGSKFKNGDTLLARITPCLENGKTAFVDFLENNEIAFGSTEFIILREKENISDKHFLYYLARSEKFRETAIKSMTGSSGRERVQIEVIRDYEFLLPPLETQRKIAEILSSLDDKIGLLHRQNKTLESLSLTLFRHTFIDNPNRNEWEMGKLGDYVIPKKGKNITQKNAISGVYPVIAGGLEPAYYHNQSNTQSPVITISASGANAGFVNIHYCPVWSSDSSYIDSTITPYVYFSYLFLKYNQNILYDKQEGSAQPHIYPSHIMELEMPHYPKELMESFETQIQVYFEKISHNMKEIQNLESLRDIMLSKLLSGEMEV
ncbi:restriction endonuclease subunit S [Helicobacter typhlonius]|uniref:restriction endonuclease subunit S n=1 Tax=Helicobacter typhlonius TaxID=76936 RepID=UPI002FE21279